MVNASAGLMVSDTFASLVDIDPILSEIYYQNLGELDPMLQLFFNVQQSDKAVETDQRLGDFRDPEVFEGQVTYDSADADYQISYTHTEYAKGFKVQRKFWDDQQYGAFYKAAGDMGRAFRRKVEKDAASVFNNAFSTAGYDSVSLCNDSHPYSATNASTTDNNATLALTSDNLETVRQQGNALVDGNGELFSANWDLLIVPDGLKRTAHEITRSPYTPEDAENASNMFQGLQYMSWNRLTDSTAWFLVDTEMMRNSLKWYWRVMPEYSGIQDFDTYNYKMRGYMRYSFGWSEFRWIVGSTGGD